MSGALVPAPSPGRVELARSGAAIVLPEVIVDAGPVAVERFLEYFAAGIANARTRAAYGRAVGRFLAWCAARGLGLRAIAPLHVAAYIRTHPGSVPTVKQHLAAIRALCDWLVVHQVLPVNPASSVRGPKHVVTKGATPVLTPAETRALLDRIGTGTVVGLRDRALVSVMVYSFARVSAAAGMRREDYFRQGTQGWLRLREKGGRRHDVPAHHRAEEALEAYVSAAGLEDAKAPLFQSVDRTGRLSGRPLGRRAALAMVKRRAAAAGLPAATCCHTFRATGITAYLANGGTLEHAQRIAGHASPKTTKLYDRTADAMSLDEIERWPMAASWGTRPTASSNGQFLPSSRWTNQPPQHAESSEGVSTLTPSAGAAPPAKTTSSSTEEPLDPRPGDAGALRSRSLGRRPRLSGLDGHLPELP